MANIIRKDSLAAPAPMGSYKREDVIFLLKDLSDVNLERTNEDREVAIQTDRKSVV